jgi:outer membrane lipoprotein-sorting protein
MAMKFLRTVSTRRLLATITGLIVAAIAGTAIAVAAAGSGPVATSRPLAQAIHEGLGASNLQGIYARIQFTNHLIDASSLQGSDPILSGATGRLWVSSDHRLRLELQSDRGDAQVVVNRSSFWVYDPSSRTVYKGTLPSGTGTQKKPASSRDKLPTLAQIQSELTQLASHLSLPAMATGTDVGGQPAYQVRVSPKHAGGLLGSVQLAWDSVVSGLPLKFAIYASNQAKPVLELKATHVSIGAVSTKVFSVQPPTGAKVVKVATPAGGAANEPKGKTHRKAHRGVHGIAAVARQLPFPLVAPATLVGLPRRSVTLLDWAGHPAALVTYGQNLGGVAVIEQAADKSASSGVSSKPNAGGEKHGLSLPTVSIKGATGQELTTALGTMIRFTRGPVSYTVIGSVTPFAAESAAKALPKR